jgi:glycosyltransferase involved in cell wall biosynthesis/SAM-dependent methyltransferase
MRLHLIGIFHTQAKASFSHCAFTGKALRFPRMMQAEGYEVIEYSNEGSEAGATEHVPILTVEEFDKFYGNRKKTDFYGDNATIGSEPHQLFEERVIVELRQRLGKEDIICHPFGHAHQILMDKFPNHHHVETGIGYPTLMPNSFRIFESYAWMHHHQGQEKRQGRNYEWVVPNYFDLDEWQPSYKPGKYLAFLGRICSVKGMDTIKEIASYSPWPIILHGQGDPTPWEHPNIEYRGPISGTARSEFLRNARAALMPTHFTAPFAGSGVEAMLCGTPLIAVDYGAFTETIIDGVTGFRCHTLQDWIDAIHDADKLDRRVIADTARSRYSLKTCGKKYDKIFRTINNLHRKGWYQLRESDEINYTYLHNEELPFAKRLTQWIADTLAPEKVLDIGCGPGTYVDCFQELNVNATGYDSDARVDGNPHLICKSLFELQETADVVLCMEVAEHIDGCNNQQIVEVMANALQTDGILIWTAAQPGQGGVGHINCQTKDYWADLFASQPLERCPDIENQLVDAMKAGYHMGWFVQNLQVYKKVGAETSIMSK